MIYYRLFWEFFQIGLFSFGGGYATIPFLLHISQTYGWYTVEELTQMIAVAAITPGAVGINVATYAGLKCGGIFGAIISTISEILPAFFIVIIVSKILTKFQNNFYVNCFLEVLKPISCALLTVVAIKLLIPYLHSIFSLILLSILFLMSWKTKKTTLFYILISAALGVIYAIIIGGGI